MPPPDDDLAKFHEVGKILAPWAMGYMALTLASARLSNLVLADQNSASRRRQILDESLADAAYLLIKVI